MSCILSIISIQSISQFDQSINHYYTVTIVKLLHVITGQLGCINTATCRVLAATRTATSRVFSFTLTSSTHTHTRAHTARVRVDVAIGFNQI
jgi:hypothetical protein